jgi:uncharacterized protein (TIRG00374 family)
MKNSAKNKKYYLRFLIALAVLAIFLKWVKIKDYSLILESLGYFKFWYACILLVVVQIIKTLRFHILVSEYGVRVPIFKNILIHCTVPILGSLTPSKLGEGAKLLMVGEKKEKAGFCFILEKLADLTILFVLGLIGVFRYTIFVNAIYLTIPLIIAGVLGLIYFDRIFNLLFQRLLKHRLEKNWFLTNLKLFVKPKHISLVVLSVLVWFCNIYAAYEFSRIAGFEISFFDFAPIFASSIFVGLLSGLPGGIGSRETALGLLFYQVFRIELEQGGLFSLLNLFGNYFTFSLIGFIAYIIYKRKYGTGVK